MESNVMPNLVPILITLIVFAFIALIVLIERKSIIRRRELIHKERLALIEKGKYDFPEEFRKGINLPRYMAWGFIFSAFGLALILGLAINREWDGIIAGLMFLFIGFGLLLFYKIQSKKEEAKAANESSRD